MVYVCPICSEKYSNAEIFLHHLLIRHSDCVRKVEVHVKVVVDEMS